MTLAFGACQRYAKKYECPIFNDDNFDGVFGKVGIINRRPLTPVKFAKELETFSKYGTNSNAIDFTPIYVSFKNVSIKQSQRSFAEIKYGYRPQAIRSLMEIVVNTIPNGIDYLFSDFGNAVTLATSNLKGPSALIPVPAYDNANEDKKEDDKVNNVNEYVSWLWGMGVPAMMPMSFTLLTYNKHVRIGVMTDAGSVKEPNKLMECFMEEWDQYNIIQ